MLVLVIESRDGDPRGRMVLGPFKEWEEVSRYIEKYHKDDKWGSYTLREPLPLGKSKKLSKK